MTLADSGPRLSSPAFSSFQLVRAQRRDGQLLRRALALALAAHIGALFVPVPKRPTPPASEPIRPTVIFHDLELKPPEATEPREVQPAASPRRSMLPVPEPTEDFREPLTEPAEVNFEDAPVAELLIPDDPDPPPVTGPLPETFPGLVRPVPCADRVRPEYPRIGRILGLEARVVLKAIVDRTGEVVDVQAIESPRADPGFTDAAVAAVSQWCYEPARYRGQPVAVEINVIVEFLLD